MTDFYHSIIGLPESGKTTFLAALWHIIDAGEVSTVLELYELTGDRSYLNDIVETWRTALKVPHTPLDGGEVSISIHMRQPSSGDHVVLGFSDLSGESFGIQFASRKCEPEYVECNDKDGGILLFVNANRGHDGIGILDLAPVMDDGEQVGQPDSIKDWSHDCVPQEVQLVDLLQFLQKAPFVRRKRRLAVVISAYDVVDPKSIEPQKWLERELPFLYQYIAANPDIFEFRVYGVSAQGGDLPEKEDGGSEEQQKTRADLLKKIPSERITCVGPGINSHDLTAPICWLTRME